MRKLATGLTATVAMLGAAGAAYAHHAGETETLWEAIARHAQIIFSRPEYRDDDLSAVLRHHQDLLHVIEGQIAKAGTQEELHDALEAHLRRVQRSRQISAGRQVAGQGLSPPE